MVPWAGRLWIITYGPHLPFGSSDKLYEITPELKIAWLLHLQCFKRGTPEREKFEEGFETFKLGVMLQELRKESGMTQEQLAEKCGTTKTYISRIENNSSDIRLSTLMRIFREGFGKQLKLSI